MNTRRPPRSAWSLKLWLLAAIAVAGCGTAQIVPSAPPSPTTTATPRPPTAGTPAFETGIFEGGDGLLAAADVAIYQRWQGYVNGQPARVYAGLVVADPEQGVILTVLAWPDGTAYGERDVFPASGPPQIVSEENLRLVLASDSGTYFFYDIPGLDFVPALDSPPRPTVTRAPAAATASP